MSRPEPVPLLILTGFLGAGKTSVLNHILRGDHGLRVAVLVNDFGALHIDAHLLIEVDRTQSMLSLTNGCICCTIRGDLVGAVENLLAQEAVPDVLIVETSGVTDPIDVVILLRQLPGIRLDSVMTVIDAEQFADALRQFPTLALNQAGTADLILLNKTDLVSPAQVDAVKDELRRIAPRARILETSHGAAPLSILLAARTMDAEWLAAQHDHQHDHSEQFSAWHWQQSGAADWRRLKRAVAQFPADLLRAKGIFRLEGEPDRRAVLHLTGKRVELSREEIAPPEQSQFVCIAPAGMLDEDALRRLLDSTARGESSLFDKVSSTLHSWLRQGMDR